MPPRYTADFGTGFYWHSRTGFVLLPTLDQANPCRNTFGGRDVNDTLKIVGISCKGGTRHAVEWRDIPVP